MQITDIIKDNILKILREAFTRHPEYPFSADPLESKVIICDSYAASLEDAEKKPLIVLMRPGLSIAEVGGISKFVNRKTGAYQITLNVGTTIEINCVAKSGIVAERLASFIALLFIVNKDELRKYGFHKIQSIGISGEMPQEFTEREEKVIVSVSIQTILMLTFEVVPETLEIREIGIEVHAKPSLEEPASIIDKIKIKQV
jgi:hypothetical protein